MLNNCEAIDTIARDKCFDRTGNVQSKNQQAKDKGDKKVDSDTYASVSSTKTSFWSGLQISLHGRKK